jgi:hypothetical protein
LIASNPDRNACRSANQLRRNIAEVLKPVQLHLCRLRRRDLDNVHQGSVFLVNHPTEIAGGIRLLLRKTDLGLEHEQAKKANPVHDIHPWVIDTV